MSHLHVLLFHSFIYPSIRVPLIIQIFFIFFIFEDEIWYLFLVLAKMRLFVIIYLFSAQPKESVPYILLMFVTEKVFMEA